ncbi:hypothetical protein PS854_04091 [Pseudomonas fluorescens]|uniref:LysE family translocator n=2 Tax=Pseudomonas fluorescens TaxID=294 RepID=A0A5E7MPM3_PSEFL|nr:hypothetical protein PS854_04091 [Pseudomonas fluorescens]
MATRLIPLGSSMPLTEYLFFTIIAVAQATPPRPSTLFLVNHTLAHSPIRSILILSGDLLATTLLAICSLLTIDSLLWSFPNILKPMQIAGSVYILWLSAQYLLKTKDNRARNAQHVIYGRTSVLWARSFFAGISNLKTVLFFFSLLPQFIVTSQETYTATLLLPILFFVWIRLLVSSAYALTATKMAGWRNDPRAIVWSYRVRGTMMLIFGIAIGINAVE